MPTIAEIIAAKKAAASKAAPAPQQSEPKLFDALAERMAAEAINRIDPPAAGKRRAGLVLSAKTPLQPAETAEKAHHAALRSLSQPEGEAIPLTPCNASQEVETWHEADEIDSKRPFGASNTAVRQIFGLYQQRLNEEKQKQLTQYPTRVHYSR